MRERVMFRTFHGALVIPELKEQVDVYRVMDSHGDLGDDLSGFWNQCGELQVDTVSPPFPNPKAAQNYLKGMLKADGPLIAIPTWTTETNAEARHCVVWMVGGRCRVPRKENIEPVWNFSLD